MLLSGTQLEGAHELYEGLDFDSSVERGFVLER